MAHSVNVIGGAERVSLATISGLCDKYRMAMLTPEGGALGIAAEKAGAKALAAQVSVPQWTRPYSSIARQWRLASVLRSERTDIVHAGDILAFRALSWPARRCSSPILCHMHYPYPESFLEWIFAGKPGPDMFVFCSDELRKAIGPFLSKTCPDSHQQVIHNGVDVDHFYASVPVAAKATPRIGIVANLQARKGHEDFLQMAALLKQRNLGLHYDIIGGDILESPRQPGLERFCDELGLSDVTTFHGQVDDVRSLLHQLDVLVCASHEEAFPVSILEAMACAKPIVATRVNGIPEAIDHGVTGLLVASHAPEQLADAVQLLVNQPGKAHALGVAARERVLTDFSSSAYARKIHQTYKSLLA